MTERTLYYLELPMLLRCSKCSFEVESDKQTSKQFFYLKYKTQPPTMRSSWCSYCSKCQKDYKSKYYKNNGKKLNKIHKDFRDTHKDQCLKLEAARRLARAENPDEILRYRNIVALNEKDRYIHDRFMVWKSGARKRHIEWTLQETDIHRMLLAQNGLCFYTNQPLVLGTNSNFTLSLDRIDSRLHYTQDNVVLCATVVNLMKLDTPLDDFKRIIALLNNHLNVTCRP